MISVKESAILSIDYGERYFGFAVKLINETTIFALEIIDSKSFNIKIVIQEYIDKYNVEFIVVGYPIGLRGSKTRMSKLVDNFIKDLKKLTKLEIHTVDERFTTKIHSLYSNTRVDSAAALLNLETYIKNHE